MAHLPSTALAYLLHTTLCVRGKGTEGKGEGGSKKKGGGGEGIMMSDVSFFFGVTWTNARQRHLYAHVTRQLYAHVTSR